MLPAPPWVEKFFVHDASARIGWTLLAPQFHSADLALADPGRLGPEIVELGERLLHEGSLPGLPSWEPEESPEIEQSIAVMREALGGSVCAPFDQSVQRAVRLAEAGFQQMGRLAPRLAGLRWASCLCWMATRSAAASKRSAGGSFGTVPPLEDVAANKAAKLQIFGWLKEIVQEPSVRTIFDFDLMGHGVWHGGGREPLPRDAEDEWFRRGFEYDLIRLWMQATELPPDDWNAAAPKLRLVQPYGTPDLLLQLDEIPRLFLAKHGWVAEVRETPLAEQTNKAPLNAAVLHAEKPPPPEPDLDDPEVQARLMADEELDKGLQEDGLPGAVHGSVSLHYAALCMAEKVEQVQLYPGLIALEGFVEYFFKFGPPLRGISFSGCDQEAPLEQDILELVPLLGPSLWVLDLECCGLNQFSVEALVDVLAELPGLKHLDLAGNQFNANSALRLLQEICELRVDLAVLRLDKNPLGNTENFRAEVAHILAERAEKVMGGGDLIFQLGDQGVTWCVEPKEGTLADRIRTGRDLPTVVSLKDVRRFAERRRTKLDQYEREDPAATSSGGRDWLRRQREQNAKVFASPLIEFYRDQLHRNMEEKKAVKRAEAVLAGDKEATAVPPSGAAEEPAEGETAAAAAEES